MKARFTEVLWLESHPDIGLSDLSELSGLPEAELRALTDYGVLAPVDPDAEQPSYRAGCIVTARRASRLRADLELDTEGLALVLRLMAQMQELESQLKELKARLPDVTRDEREWLNTS
jgi:chaperone modulatory protein CbpM